jgi:hypothetical protein
MAPVKSRGRPKGAVKKATGKIANTKETTGLNMLQKISKSTVMMKRKCSWRTKIL